MKKKLLFAAMLFCGSLVDGQTNIIASKSTSSDLDELSMFNDNYGDHPGMHLIDVDSVVYYPLNKVVVQYRTGYRNAVSTDTFNYQTQNEDQILDHLKAIRNNGWYPTKTQFIGFPAEIENAAKQKKSTDFSVLPFVMIISMIGGAAKFGMKNKI